MALTWEELAVRSLGRQLPVTRPQDVVGMLEATGPIQSQTARSPFLALAARFPGITHDELTAAYKSFEVVRGSTLRGTVHTCTARQHPALDAGTRRPREAELDGPVAALEAALAISVTSVTVTREVA